MTQAAPLPIIRLLIISRYRRQSGSNGSALPPHRKKVSGLSHSPLLCVGFSLYSSFLPHTRHDVRLTGDSILAKGVSVYVTSS